MKNKNVKSSFIKLLILIIALVVVSYAWFYEAKETGVGSYTIATMSFNNVEMSLDEGETWSMSGNLFIPTEFLFENEITGDGSTFYRAANKNEDGDPIGFVPALVNEDYLEFNIRFKATKDSSLFLEQGSYVRPSAGILSTDLIGPSVERISTGGDYSRDLIASAVRVALIDSDYIDDEFVHKSEAALVWAPNPNVEMVYNSGIYTPILNSNNQQDYKHYFYDGDNYVLENVANIKDIIGANAVGHDSGGDPLITSVISEQVKQITIRVWIEGTDREALTELKGGQFFISFSFVGITKLFDTVPPTVTVSGSNISGYDATMEHSANFGLTWIKYADNINPSFPTGTTVRVRKSETENFFPSTYTELIY